MSGLLRTTALFLSFAFGIIGMGVGINGAVKIGDTKDYVRNHAPEGVTLHIDTSDGFDSGAVLTVGCALVALTSLFTFLLDFVRPRIRKTQLGLAFLHFLWAAWVFATLVAFDVIARNRSAKIEAFLGSTQLPDSVIEQQEQTLGFSAKYWDYNYIKYPAIIPWFTFLFAIITGIVLLRTTPRRDKVLTAASDAGVLREGEEIEGKRSAEKGDPESPTKV